MLNCPLVPKDVQVRRIGHVKLGKYLVLRGVGLGGIVVSADSMG